MAGYYIVERKLDYYKEAIELVYRVVNNKSYKQLKTDMLRRTETFEHQRITTLLEPLIKIEEEMKPFIDASQERIQYFFKIFSGDDICRAKILYQGLSYIKKANTLKEQKQQLVRYLHRALEDDTLELTLTKNEFQISPYEEGTSASLIDRINHLECDDSKKWGILYLLEHAESCIEELFQLLKPIVVKLKQFDPILKNLLEDCADYWEDYFKQESVLVLINNFYGLTENSYEEMTTYIRPQIMNCDYVLFIGNDETMGEYHVMEMGITFDKNFKATKKRPTKEQICNGLKLLSDPSKFEILKQINGRKAYGQELAKLSKLTTATISYHMNALMGFGFITIEKMDNKVFYSMNKDAVKEFLMVTMEELVEEERNEV